MIQFTQNAVRRTIALSLFAAFLVFIPFLGIYHILGVLENAETSLARQTASEELQEIAAHMSRLAHPETACRELAERLSRTITWNGDLRPLLKAWPAGAIKLYLFDAKGRRVNRSGCTTGMTVASERVLGLILRAAQEGQFALSPAQKNQVESFLGSHATFPLLSSRPDHLHDFAFTGTARYAGWYQVRARSGKIAGHLLIFFEQKKIEPLELALQACRKMDRLVGNEMAFGWLDMSNSHRSGLGSGRLLSRKLARRINQLPMEAVHWGRKHLLALNDTTDGIRLFCLRPIPAPPDFLSKLRSFMIVLLVEIILILIWAAILGRNILIPLRMQLLGWFGIAAVAGLAALVGFSHVYGQARQASLIRDNRNFAVRLLQRTDANFSPAFAPLAREYRQAAREMESKPGNLSSPTSLLAPLAKARRFSAAFVCGSTDAIRDKLVTTPDTGIGIFANEQEQIIQALAQKAMDKFNAVPEYDPANSTTGSRNMLNVLLDRPVEQLIKQRGTLQPMTVNGVNATVFLELICTADGIATAALVVLHDTPALEAMHLRVTATNLELHTRHRLIALPKRSSGNIPSTPAVGLLREPDMEHLQELLDLTGATQHRLGRFRGERMLITAVPGQVMSDYHLFLLTPFQSIDDQVRAVSTRIRLMALAGTGFSLLLAWMFGGLLLGPMRVLTEGIARLVTMRLGEPVRVTTGDELQRIGDGVTRIMEDLQERALAKTVQEHLLSGKPLTGPGWHLQGWSRSASDIGGEIFDMQILDDGRTAFMIGDVAARGVSAALVMAMAKTAVRLFLDEPNATPTVVLSELDRYFRIHARRLSQVGMLLGIYDPSTGLLRYAATGWLYPIFLTHDDAPQLLTVDGNGLGAGSSGRASPEHQQAMKPGDKLVICTDGLIEARDPAGRAAGVDGISDLLDGLRSEDPGQIGGRLWEALNAWQGGLTPADDQTLLLLAVSPRPADPGQEGTA